jgi:hypothetical protein
MTGTIPLTIEWRHLEIGGFTCNRCSDTGTHLGRAIARLRREGMLDGVDLNLEETVLSPDEIRRSNTLLINGVPIEDLLDVRVTFTECSSCSDLTGESECCRAVSAGHQVFEEIPEEMIRAAILKAIERERSGHQDTDEDTA